MPCAPCFRLGAFYSPLIAPITVIKMFVFFYAKKVRIFQICLFSANNLKCVQQNLGLMGNCDTSVVERDKHRSVMFQVSLLHTCAPSRKTFRASNIQSFFVTILLLSFVLCIAPIVYTITK